MTGFAGTGQLSRLAFRRDCVVLPACVFGIAALLAITARDLKVLYPTAAGLARSNKGQREPGTAIPPGPTERHLGRRLPRRAVGRVGGGFRGPADDLHRGQAHPGR